MDKVIDKPSISVIMPVYNCHDFIHEAVESVLNQTFANFELLIIDDCSQDNTVEIINSFNDPRMVLIRKERKSGLIDSLNIGLKNAKGKYIARMDGDDICHSERFEKQSKFLDTHPEIAVCGSWCQIISSNKIIKFPTKHNEIKRSLLNSCVFCHPTVMIRSKFLIENAIKYNEAFEAAEDYELWTQIISDGGITANIPEVLLHYRAHENQVSKRQSIVQYQNSLLCMAKMLCLPLSTITNNDYNISNTIIKNIRVKDKKRLYEIIDWLDELKLANRTTQVYEGFDDYLNIIKINFVSMFFYHLPKYKISLLSDFFKLDRTLKLNLSFTEKIRIVAKCLLFWKSKVK